MAKQCECEHPDVRPREHVCIACGGIASGPARTPTAAPARNPCGSCPYRRDVPSGVWSAEEYDKLPAYDNGTPFQPPAVFFCHQQNGRLCAGWVGCHDMNESLGLRIAVNLGLIGAADADAALDYESPVPLFASGAETAEHGKADIEEPGPAAQRTITRLTRKQERRANAATEVTP